MFLGHRYTASRHGEEPDKTKKKKQKKHTMLQLTPRNSCSRTFTAVVNLCTMVNKWWAAPFLLLGTSAGLSIFLRWSGVVTVLLQCCYRQRLRKGGPYSLERAVKITRNSPLFARSTKRQLPGAASKQKKIVQKKKKREFSFVIRMHATT